MLKASHIFRAKNQYSLHATASRIAILLGCLVMASAQFASADVSDAGKAIMRWTTPNLLIGDLNSTGGTATTLLFRTNNTDWMKIDGSGFVGIGNITPTYPLHVSSTNYKGLKLATSAGSSDILLTANPTTGGYFNLNSNGGTGGFRFGTGNPDAGGATAGVGTELMRLESSGKLGVGITTPSALFHASMLSTTSSEDQLIAQFGHRTSTGRDVELGISYRGLSLGSGTLVLSEERAGKDFLVVNMLPTGSPRVTFPNGNIGVGITAPNALFHVSALGSATAEDRSIARFGNRISSGRNVEMSIDYRGASLGDGTLVLREDRAGKDFLVVNMLPTGSPRVTFPNGNIGIGTAAPNSILDVAGTIVSRGASIPTVGIGTELDYDVAAGVGRVRAYDRNAGGAGWKGIVVGQGLTVAANGDLSGIGKATFTGLLTNNDRLVVNGNTAGQSALDVNQTQTGNVALFKRAGVTKVLIDNAGNVGLDTNAANAKLVIKGEARITDGTNGVLSFRGNSTGTQIITGKQQGSDRDLQFMDRDYPSNVETELARLTSTGRFGIGTSNPGTKLDVVGDFRLTQPLNGVLTFRGNSEGAQIVTGKTQGGNRDLQFMDRDYPSNVETELARLTKGGAFGIGTSAPQQKLHVRGSGIEIEGDNASQDADLLLKDMGGFGWRISGVNNNHRYRVYNNYSNQESFSILQDNGYVGIGNSNPRYKLDVSGTIFSSGASQVPTSGVGMELDYDIAGGIGRVRAYDRANGAFKKTVVGNGFVVEPSGDVSAMGKAGFLDEVLIVNATNGTIAMRGNDSGAQIVTGKGQGGDRNLQFMDRDPFTHVEKKVAQLTSTGDLGVTGEISTVNATNGTLTLRGNDQGAQIITGKGQGSTRDLQFMDRAYPSNVETELARLKKNGDFSVIGSVTAASVNTKVWSIAPDYVFEKDYELKSLDQVESFVKKNKHLPEVPSAKEIKAKGLDLAEMNMKLLKKVEELTLYSIQQSKEIQSLSSRLNRIESGHNSVGSESKRNSN